MPHATEDNKIQQFNRDESIQFNAIWQNFHGEVNFSLQKWIYESHDTRTIKLQMSVTATGGTNTALNV